MKSVMISIKPKWCKLIASGKKTVEIRKTRPKIETPFKCYIYCTKPSKKYQTISGSMVFNSDRLYRHPKSGIKYGDGIEMILLDEDEYSEDNFLNGKVIGEFICDEITSGFWISPFSDYIQNQSCLSYDELCDYANGKPILAWHISDLVIYDQPKGLSEFRHCGENYHFNPIVTNPPQSWCYCEEVEE